MKIILVNSNFRWLWYANVLIILGELVRMMLVSWIVLDITDSPLWVGVNMGVAGLGMMAVSNFGGVLADVLSRKMLVIVGGVIHFLISLFLAFSLYFNYLELWELILASFVWGSFSGLRGPATAALTLDVVGRAELLNANAAKFIGIGLAGIIAPILLLQVLNYFGNLGGFIFIALIQVISILVISRLSLPSREFDISGLEHIDFRLFRATWSELLEGMHYIFSKKDVKFLILMALLSEIFVWPHGNMLPVIARDVLDVGLSGFGYLQSVGWFGFVIAPLLLAGVGHHLKNKGLTMVLCALSAGILIIAFSLSRNFILSMSLLSLAWASASIFEVILVTFLQSIVPDNMRGRVVGFQAFTWGINAFSGFHFGFIAQLTSAPWAIIINSIIFVGYAIFTIPWAKTLSTSTQEDVIATSIHKLSN